MLTVYIYLNDYTTRGLLLRLYFHKRDAVKQIGYNFEILVLRLVSQETF